MHEVSNAVSYGDLADYANWTDTFTVPGFVNNFHDVSAADYAEGDSILTLAGALPAMSADGSLTFPNGAFLSVSAYVSGSWVSAPDAGARLGAMITVENGEVVQTTVPNVDQDGTVDGVVTYAARTTLVLVVVRPGGKLNPLRVVNGDNEELTVDGVELTITRVG